MKVSPLGPVQTRYQLVDKRTGKPIFTVPATFDFMTTAALYALQHDLVRAEVKPVSQNKTLYKSGHGRIIERYAIH
jgi:hypothetical protein